MQGSLFSETSGIGDEIGDLERWCRARDIDLLVGVDEAGRGPLAGPVYAAAVALEVGELEGDWIAMLDDSKKLTEPERETAFNAVRASAPAWAIADRSPSVIDEINILEATREAMMEAVEAVVDALDDAPTGLFIDGDVQLPTRHRQQALVEGDGRSYAIAAASILAKVARDRVMSEYGAEWPGYNFASNKGYPTPDHRAALSERGPCPIHRTSFSGVGE